MTPEGRVKEKVKALLNQYGAYYFMPVQGGYGKPGLDFHCCHHGMALFIETKAPGKQPTARQKDTMLEIDRAEGAVMVIDDDISLDLLREWLQGWCELANCQGHAPPDEPAETVEYKV